MRKYRRIDVRDLWTFWGLIFSLTLVNLWVTGRFKGLIVKDFFFFIQQISVFVVVCQKHNREHSNFRNLGYYLLNHSPCEVEHNFRCSFIMRTISLCVLPILLSLACAYDNGLGATPPRGWTTWCTNDLCGLRDRCSEYEIMKRVDAMVNNQMVENGYDWYLFFLCLCLSVCLSVCLSLCLSVSLCSLSLSLISLSLVSLSLFLSL